MVSAGEVVEVTGTEPEATLDRAGEPAVAFSVVWEDPHLLVVDKPAGLVVHPARGHWTGTLAQALAGRAAGGEDPTRAGIVHRLDRDTSGLLVVARDEATHRALKAQLAARELHREYLALADGIPEARTGTIEAPIGRDPRDRKLMAVGGRRARRLGPTSRSTSCCAARRCCASCSTPAAPTRSASTWPRSVIPSSATRPYGGPARYGLRRQFLHAERLSFRHPETGEELDLRSPLPADLADALEAARARMRDA